ncbi:hypothetical protein VTI74DRAFT_71 [Chaetomium olivicolor]
MARTANACSPFLNVTSATVSVFLQDGKRDARASGCSALRTPRRNNLANTDDKANRSHNQRLPQKLLQVFCPSAAYQDRQSTSHGGFFAKLRRIAAGKPGARRCRFRCLHSTKDSGPRDTFVPLAIWFKVNLNQLMSGIPIRRLTPHADEGPVHVFLGTFRHHGADPPPVATPPEQQPAATCGRFLDTPPPRTPAVPPLTKDRLMEGLRRFHPTACPGTLAEPFRN